MNSPRALNSWDMTGWTHFMHRVCSFIVSSFRLITFAQARDFLEYFGANGTDALLLGVCDLACILFHSAKCQSILRYVMGDVLCVLCDV